MTRTRFSLPWIAAILCLFVRLIGLFQLSGSDLLVPSGGDTRFYADWALRITRGEWTDGLAFYGLPGYSWWLAGIFLVAGFNPFMPALLQAMADALVAWLIVSWVQRLSPFASIAEENSPAKHLAPIAAAALWIFYQPAAAYSLILMPTILVVAVYWSVWYWAAHPPEKLRWWGWLLGGVGLGLVAMMVATIFFAIPALLARAWLGAKNSLPVSAPKRFLRTLAAAVLVIGGVLIGCSPAWLHNWLVAKDPVLLTAHSGLNLFIGNNATSTGYPSVPPGMQADQAGMLMDSITFAEEEAGRPLKRSEVSAFWSRQAKEWIRENRTAWLSLQGVKLQNFWNTFEYDDLSIVQILKDQGVLHFGVGFGLLVIFAFAGLAVVIIQRRPNAAWIVAAIFFHMCALLPVFVTERYRLAAAPGLVMLAACGLAGLAWWWTTGAWKRASIVTASAIMGAWVTAAHLPPQSVWSVGEFNAGLANLELGQLERAGIRLQSSLARTTDNTEVIFSVGNWHLEENRLPIAAALYQRALEIRPTHHRAANNLAVILVTQKQWSQAIPLLELAIRLDPGDPKRFYLLAIAQEAQGNRKQALAAAQTALEMAPQVEAFRQLLIKIQQAP